MNEIADIEEITAWIARESKINKSEIKHYRERKNRDRGSFKKKLFLIETN